MRKLLLVTFFLATLTGCAGNGLSAPSAEKVPLRIQFNGEPSANFAGYYQALEQGFYAKHGLSVSLLPGGMRGGVLLDPAEVLLSGQSEFAILTFAQYQSISQDRRRPLVVMALFQISPLVFLSAHEQDIIRLQDIRGKRVAIFSPEGENLMRRALENAGMSLDDITAVPLETPDIQIFYRQEVDVWPGYLTEDGVQCLVDGHRVNMVFAADYGLNTYEGLLVTTQDYADTHPEATSALIGATLEGWRYALENADGTADLLSNLYPQHSRVYYQLGLEYLHPLADTGEAPLGWIDDTRWKALLDVSPTDSAAPGYDMHFVEEAHTQK